MRISFYLPNKNFANVDCSHPELGNPGIGGTEYMVVSVAYYLEKLYPESHEYVVLANHTDRLPSSVKAVRVEGLADVPRVMKERQIDLLVLKYALSSMKELSKESGLQVNVVFWTHNFVKRQELTLLACEQKVKAIVCVGTEQLQFYRDHRAYRKSVVIFNGYPINFFKQHEMMSVCPFKQRGNEVTYMGNLVDYKGFHLLAQAWKSIVAKVPDAHLNVIGSGTLYSRDSKIGRWGYADEQYEQMFMPHLLDDDGRLLPSVTFHGVLGKEKDEVLNITKVGVPNPGGVSETFCITAVEMQLWGSIVTTIAYGGFLDTVHSTGILYDTPAQLADAVVAQLRKTDNDYAGCMKFLERFSFENVSKDWITLFNAIEKENGVDEILKPAPTERHWFEERNRKWKVMLPLGRFLPTKMFYRSLLLRVPIVKKYV